MNRRMTSLFFLSAIGIVLISGCTQTQNTNNGPVSNGDLYKDLIACENLDQNSLIDKCKEAGQQEIICDNMYMNGLISECQKAVQKASGDPRICDYYESVSGKDFCLYWVGTGSLDETVCAQAHNQGEVEGAIANWKDSCYRDVAIGKKSAAMCENIGRVTIKNECFWKVAVATGDPNLCRNIDNNRSIELCLGQIATG